MRLEVQKVPDDQIAALVDLGKRQSAEPTVPIGDHVAQMEAKAREVMAAMGLSSGDGWRLSFPDFCVRRFVVEPTDAIH